MLQLGLAIIKEQMQNTKQKLLSITKNIFVLSHLKNYRE